MENMFIKCTGKEHAKRIADFFNTMGYSSTINYEYITINRYAGIFEGLFLQGLKKYELENINTKIIEIPNKDSYYNFNRKTAIHCRTKGIAKKVLEIAHKRGYKWSSGRSFISSESHWDRYEQDTCYLVTKGLFTNLQKVEQKIENDRGLKIISAEEFLYGITDIEAINSIPFNQKDLIPFDKLVKNTWYTYFSPIAGGKYRKTHFKYEDKRCFNNSFDYISLYGSLERDFIFGREDPNIVKLSKEDRKLIKPLIKKSEENRIFRYRKKINSLIRKKIENRGKKLGYKKHNEDKKTQLLSTSFHECLYKIKDESKVARSLMKLNNLGYDRSSIRNLFIRKSSENKPMTFCPQGKETELSDCGNWKQKGRQEGKYGKLIRKVLKEQVPNLKYTDQDIEKLVNHIKAYYSDGDFKIVEGEEIRYWYHYKNYSEESGGTLPESCMRHEKAQSYLDIYVENPETIKMIILVKQGKLIGRALLWDNKWMDRIYGSDSIIKAFTNYAKENNLNCKAEQNSDCHDEWVRPDGTNFHERLTFSIITSFNKYPYADTFFYINVENGEISNSDREGWGKLRETDGTLEIEGTIYDEVDERYISHDDAIYVSCRNVYTHINNAGFCDWSDEYYLSENMVETLCGSYVYEDNHYLVQVEGGYCHIEDAYTCEHSNNMYYKGHAESVHLPELNMTVMENHVSECYENHGYVEVNGSWIEKTEIEESI